jgi:hypothetical protein
MFTTILAFVIAVLGFVMICAGVYSFFDLWMICGGFAMSGIAQGLRLLVAIANAIQPHREADRAARLEQINILTDNLSQSEADRDARLEQINVLTNALKESEADRAARFKVIEGLKDQLNQLETNSAVHQSDADHR